MANKPISEIAKDTVIMRKQTRAKRKELFPHGHKDCFECEHFVKESQAVISLKAGIRYVLDWAVTDGCLSTVNKKHGIHIPDELYDKLKKEGGTP